MRPRRTALCISVLVVALLLQVSLVARTHTPVVTPQLLLTVLVVCAMVEGPMAGCVLGFGTGLVADLLSAHQVGRLALVLTVVGYVSGKVQVERSAVRALVTVAVATVATFLLDGIVGVALGDLRVKLVATVGAALAAAAYDVLLTPFLLPPLRGLLTRLDPDSR